MSEFKPGDRVRVFDPTNELLIYEGYAASGASGTVLRIRNGKVRVQVDGTAEMGTEGDVYSDFAPERVTLLPPSPASRAATAGEEAERLAEAHLEEYENEPNFSRNAPDQVRFDFIAGHASATKGLRERLEGVKEKVEEIAGAGTYQDGHITWMDADHKDTAKSVLATLREILGELKNG
jgi:hypothetical protein